MQGSIQIPDPKLQYLLRLGDDRLILGHRLSEWCGHAPILEEDIALTNISLDLVGQATLLLELAGEGSRAGHDEDQLAFFREGTEFRNALIMELPRGDFAFTALRSSSFPCSTRCLERLRTRSTPSWPVSPRRRSRRCGITGTARTGCSNSATAREESRTQRRRRSMICGASPARLFEMDALEQALVDQGVAVDPGVDCAMAGAAR